MLKEVREGCRFLIHRRFIVLALARIRSPTTHISRNDARRNVEQRWDLFLESSLAGVTRRPGQEPDGSLLQALTVKIRIDNPPEASRPFRRSTARYGWLFLDRDFFFSLTPFFLFLFFFFFFKSASRDTGRSKTPEKKKRKKIGSKVSRFRECLDRMLGVYHSVGWFGLFSLDARQV